MPATVTPTLIQVHEAAKAAREKSARERSERVAAAWQNSLARCGYPMEPTEGAKGKS